MSHWKGQLQEGAPGISRRGTAGRAKTKEALTASLDEAIERLQGKVDFLKKALLSPMEERRR